MSALSEARPVSRRGVCPALSAPMQTGDGLLSRVAFTGDLSPVDIENLCHLAARHGNGLIDITARGSVQFRGLTVESAPSLEQDVLTLDLPLRQGLAVETSPLSGMGGHEIADPRAIASRISERAMELSLHDTLAAKMSVIVDGGGLVQMGDLLADIRLKAFALDGGVFWCLMLGGSEGKALFAGALRGQDAADSVLDLLSCLAERGADARGRDLDLETVRKVCGARLLAVGGAGLSPSALSDISPASRQRGPNQTDHRLWRLDDERWAAVVAPAFGQAGSEALSSLCNKASELGINAVRPGPMHALYFTGGRRACKALLDEAKNAGFIVNNHDPRSAIAVCSGSPACASAFVPVRELAGFLARECAGLLDGSFTLHLSGCAKGCAHPSPALLAFSGTPDGLAFGYRASVSATADASLYPEDQKAAFSRLARLYEKEHKPGEDACALFTRLGKTRIVEALRQDET